MLEHAQPDVVNTQDGRNTTGHCMIKHVLSMKVRIISLRQWACDVC